MLVPNSPSLMDKVTSYSTWVPPAAMRPPSRAYPSVISSFSIHKFKLLSLRDDYTRTLANEAVDAYGIFTPLLSFHEIKSRCQTDEQMEVSPPPDTNEYDINPQTRRPIKPKNKIEVTTTGKSVLKAHPYIITRYINFFFKKTLQSDSYNIHRTHLNIMDMTRLYDRRAFALAHRGLSITEVRSILHYFISYPNLYSLPDAVWRALA